MAREPLRGVKMNRRSFLRRGSVAVATGFGLPYIVPASALGKAGSVAPSERIVMGAIGVGSQGTGNLQAFLGLRDAHFVAVCDVDRGHAAGAKQLVDKAYGGQDCKTYADHREMIARGDLDAVSIALPDHWHGIVAVDCARAGLDIYGEKPLARTIVEGRMISNAVSRYGRIWQTGSWQRSEAHFRRACELVINGRIGKVTRVEVGLPTGGDGPEPRLLPVPRDLDWDRWLGPAPFRPYQSFSSDPNGSVHWDWRWIMDYSGGQLTDWAGHHVDIAHWGLGLEYTGPVEVEGQGVYPDHGIYNVPKAYKCRCRYATGVEMIVANDQQQPKGMGTAWYGDRGWVHVDRGNRLFASDPAILREAIGPNEIHLYRSDNHHGNFLACVRSRRQTIAPAEVAHRSISVGLLCEIAMLAGRPIRWDPQTVRIHDDAEASRLLSRPFRCPWTI
jgi:predicted dehydrogenase